MAGLTTSFKDFLKNIEQTIVKLTVLQVRTVIGEYTIAPDNSLQPIAGADLKIFESKINLLDGDIESNISSQLIGSEYDWVRDFHARKEEKGHEIINNNIKAIMSLMELYKSAKSTAAKDTALNTSIPTEIDSTQPSTEQATDFPPAV